MEKGSRVHDDETNEEAAMDMPPPSPHATPSPPHATGSSSAPPEWYSDLSQWIDRLAEEHARRFDALEAQQATMFKFLHSQFPSSPPQ